MSELITAVIVLALVLANGLFVAAEFSIVGVPRVAVERRAAAGDRVARTVLGILRDNRRRDRYIATAQLGITVASLGLGMYGEHKLAEAIGGGLHAAGVGDWRWLPAHTLASILAVVILTYLHIVLGEMIPKSIALQQAEGTVLWVTPVLLLVQRISILLIIFLSYLGNALLRLFGIDRATTQPEQVRTPEELQYIIRESEAGGLLRRDTANVVQELLELGDLTAGEVMVPRVRITASRWAPPSRR